MSLIYRFKFLIWATIMLSGFMACQKDPGNYTYHEINEASVSDLDSLYTVRAGSTLDIKPKISYSRDETGDTTNYSYTWLDIGYKTGVPRVIGKGQQLSLKMNNKLGSLNYAFRITDNKTGVFKDFYFKALVINDYYEGWYLLSETDMQQSRLDMLSYDHGIKKYKFIKNVLLDAKSSLKLQGSPSFIEFFNTNAIVQTNETLDAMMIGTSEIATFLGVDNLDFLPSYTASRFFLDGNNNAIGSGSIMHTASLRAYIWANNNLYLQSTGSLFAANRMSADDAPLFKSSRYFGMNSNEAVLFNDDEREFVWYPGNNSQFCLPFSNDELLFKYKIDKKLRYMKYVSYNGGEYFAVVADDDNKKMYLLRFSRSKQNYYAEIVNTAMRNAEHFEVSAQFGYIFYSVGGKLYQYDFNTGSDKEMADYGSKKISLLKFQDVISESSGNPRYDAIKKQLCVASYDENDLNNSGAFDIYSVPPINEQIVKEESYSGMGKIVSVTYRSR